MFSSGLEQIKRDFERYIQPIVRKYNHLFDEKLHNFESYKRNGSRVMAYSFTDENGWIGMVPMAGHDFL
jgi:hypothetical protein